MTEPSFEHLTALIIDDNNHMLMLLRSLLQSLGLRKAIECEDGATGYTMLREKRPDIVLTDLSMKPIDGIEFTKMVRTGKDSPNPYVPIIMVTGHTERNRVETARDAGVTEFVAKPITIQSLHKRLVEIVERPRPFVHCETYFGPDRRRRRDPEFRGPWRRKEDTADDIEIR